MVKCVQKNRKVIAAVIFVFILTVMFLTFAADVSYAQEDDNPTIELPNINIGTKGYGKPQEMSRLFYLMGGLTILSLAPYILIMTTSFIRVTIVLSFVRTALGTQQVPPTQVLMGLALMITLYIMAPVGEEIQKTALTPLMTNKLAVKDFPAKAVKPIQGFLLKQTRDDDLKLFVELSRRKPGDFKTRGDVPFHVLLPAFVLSEIKTAFEIGFVVYLPFLVIDMVVASVLMSMGMFMLSPMQISMPFKLLLFVMIDGWGLIIRNLVKSFKLGH